MTGRKKNKNRKTRNLASVKREQWTPKTLREEIDSKIFESANGDAVSYELHTLLAILSTCRLHAGKAESYVLSEYVDSLAGLGEFEIDGFGNRILTIPHDDGTLPAIAFSCHTDSVHSCDGVQRITHAKGGIALCKSSQANCLGADCGTGIWLMFHMAQAKIPGLYLFHRQEESGMQGAEFIVESHPETLDGIKAIIAFDRKGLKDVISHQMSERTASDSFCEGLANLLNDSELGFDYSPCDGGSFTDSYAYRGLVPECTNLAVGYYSQHSRHETQDSFHALKLLHALLGLDYAALLETVSRNPEESEYLGFDGLPANIMGNYYQKRYANYVPFADYGNETGTSARFSSFDNEDDSSYGTRGVIIPFKSIESLIRENIYEVADLLRDWGYDSTTLADDIKKRRDSFMG
jgi:hypothetical protein